MSERRRENAGELAGLVGDLAGTVEELQGELTAGRSPRGPPTPRDLARFTSEVTIPTIILALETNIRALTLLQRALRFAAGERPSAGKSGGEARERAEQLGRETLAGLDGALADLQDALAGRPADDPARELLTEARTLRADIDDRLAADANPGEDGVGAGTDGSTEPTVDIDVESELQSIKDDVQDESEGENGDGDGDGPRE